MRKYTIHLLLPLLCLAQSWAGTSDGTPASDVGIPASDVGTPASDVGKAETQALPPKYTDQDMIFHVAGATVNVDTDIQITSPVASTHWTSKSTNSVSWTGSKPERFSFQLINDDTSILASGISLRASVAVSDGTATCDVPKVKAGSGYYVRFYDQLNISSTIAISSPFTIDEQSTQKTLNLAGNEAINVTAADKGSTDVATDGKASNTTVATGEQVVLTSARADTDPCLFF